MKLPKNRHRAPNFDLAELSEFPNSLFLDDDKKKQSVNKFILEISCAFNDLKGNLWFANQLDEYDKSDNAISAYSGQMPGFQNQLFRTEVSIIHELMVAIKDARKVMEHESFKNALRKLSAENLKAWNTLVSIALDKTAPTGNPLITRLSNFLFFIRNKTSFHYDGGYLFNAYKAWLVGHQSSPTPQSSFVYACFGKNNESSRFFYMDAILEAAFNEELKKCGLTKNHVGDLVRVVTKALRFIIENYIRALKC